MKLSHTLTLVSLGLGTLGFGVAPIALQGCSSSSGAAGSTSGTGNSILPPPAPTGPTTTLTTPQNFAIHKLYLGDTDRMGNSTANSWAGYGYNLDGLVTTATSTDVCTLPAMAPKANQVDGCLVGGVPAPCASSSDNGGIDNSFGETIMPIVTTTAGADIDSTIDMDINGGAFTIMLDIVGLDPNNYMSQTATGLSAQLFAGGKFLVNGVPATPTWTSADNWPVESALLSSTTPPFKSTISFPDAYITNGTWVSGSKADIDINLSFSGQTLSIIVHQAVVTFSRSSATHLTNGTIAGIIQTSELISGLMAIAGHISVSLCGGAAFQSIATQIEQASDIIHDGTNVAGTPCDAISIGLGFESDEIGQPTTIAPDAGAGTNPCDAGTPMEASTPMDAAAGG
jgi:hypothetical protein